MKKKYIISLLVCAAFCATQIKASANTEFDTLYSTINTDTSTPRSFTATGNMTATSNLGTQAGAGSNLTLDGAGYSLDGSDGTNRYSHLIVGTGQTITLQNFGSLNADGTVNTAVQNFLVTGDGAVADRGAVLYNNGTAYIKNSVFSNNEDKGSVIGGGVIYNTGVLDISGSTFVGNHGTATSDDWGGVLWNNGGNVTINHSTFTSNYASDDPGGAIYNDSTGNLTVKNSTFTSNHSSGGGGGAICQGSTGILTVENSIFNENYSSLQGGAIYGGNFSGKVYISGSTFTNNYAISMEGAVANRKGYMEISDSVFKGNHANGVYAYWYGDHYFGGGAVGNGEAASTMVINRCIFGGSTTAEANYGSYGGAVLNLDAATGLSINNSSFIGNHALLDGGAIFNYATGSTPSITNCVFRNNTADTNGGAIYNLKTMAIIADDGATLFTGNTQGAAGAKISNAIYNAGTMYLNADSDGTIIFNDKNTGGTWNINNTTGASVTSGNIIFNENVSNATINIASGTLTLGQYGNSLLTNAAGTAPSTEYLTSVALNLNGGTLNMANGSTSDTLNLTSFSSAAGAYLNFDADLATGKNDTISATTATGVLNVGSVHMLSDSDMASSLTLFTGAGVPTTLSDFHTYTNDYKYTFTGGASTGTYTISKTGANGFSEAVADTTTSRSFSAISNVAVSSNLAPMGGTSLDVYGNGKDITASNNTGITVASGQNLNVSNVGTVSGFKNGFINNAGTTSVTADNVQTSFMNGSGINLTGGSLFLNASNGGSITVNDAISSTSATSVVNINSSTENGTVNLNKGVNNAIVNVGSGTLNFGQGNTTNTTYDNLKMNFGNCTANISSNAVTTTFASTGTIYLNNTSTLNLSTTNNGTINVNAPIASASTDNVINVNAGTGNNGTVAFNNTVSKSTINFYNGTMSLGNDTCLDGNNVSLNGGTLSMMNGSVGTATFNNLALNNTTNLKIDADLAHSAVDRITSTNPITGTGTLNINEIKVISDATGAKTSVNFADSALSGHVTLNTTEALTPIYKYGVTYDPTTGNLDFARSAIGGSNNYQNFNPQVLAPPVASLAGVYTNQTTVYNEALGRMDALMLLPETERTLMLYRNKTASADGQIVFSPTLLPEESAGMWVKQYTSFENVPLNNGPSVSSVGYGMLVGGDTPLKSLKNGFLGYLTAYGGYNGSHQNYDQVGIYQNGGVLGLTGTVYKGKFFSALTANVGASAGNSYNMYGTDNFTTLLAGIASKTGYNFEFINGKLIFQPSFLMSYTFANTFDYTTASGVNITSNPLNALQLMPGVKLIGNLKNGWQPYLGLSMVFNIMDKQRFYANDVALPQMGVNPYVEYGIGLQRKWGERFTGFGQAMARGGGRNGLALQFGFRWAI